MGVGGQHAEIIATFLDLPEPHKWYRLLNVTEKFTHEAIKNKRNFTVNVSARGSVRKC
jgi:hypothetical protein